MDKNRIREDNPFLADSLPSQGIALNFKRILARALRYWYLIVLSLTTTLSIAYLVNRYSTRVYPVSASIILREGNENASAEFLYQNNPLINPDRNFYNELYIMRSQPLLMDVVRDLKFDVKWYREGNIKTTEVFDPNFAFDVDLIEEESTSMPYGRMMGFRAIDNQTYSIEYLSEETDVPGKSFPGLRFNEKVSVNGYRLAVRTTRPVTESDIGKYYIIEFTDPVAMAKQYASRLQAGWAEQGASVVNLSITGPLPQKEMAFLKTFISRYQQYDVDKKNYAAGKSIEFLDQQLSEIGDSLKFFDAQIETLKQSRGAASFAGEAERIYTRIEGLEDQRSKLLLAENYNKYLEEYLGKEGSLYEEIVPPTVMGISDNILNGLILQLTELQFGIRMMGDQQSDLNPMVLENRERIRQLKADILEGVRNIRKTQRITKDFLDNEILTAEKQLDRLPGSEREMVDIRRNYSIRENLYLFLMQKRAEAGISLASTTSDIIVVNPPAQSGGPITPKPIQNFSIALAIGLLVPFAFFLISELLNDKIQSKEDIEQLTSIPLIGGIGHNFHGVSNMVVNNKPKSSMAESFRALRSNLNFFTEGRDGKIILITSSVSGEGKTFTTINLATVMALMGKRVLIIGADLRKPRIFADFNLKNEVGLSTYLSSMAPLSDVIQKTSIENLHLMSGGPVPPNPGELLLLPRVDEMLKELLTRYDYIILDTPPVGLVSDVFALMPYADHTIFMVRQNYTPRYFLRDLQELLERRGLTNISILFNDIKKLGPGYGYGYGYGYGGGYGYNGYYGYVGSEKVNGYYTEK